MKFALPVVVIAAAFVPASRAADDENPYKKAKVGDWVEYKMTTGAGGMTFESKFKMTVTAKSDSEITLKNEATVMGIATPAAETKIDLTKKFDPTAPQQPLPKEIEVRTIKKAEGKEKIKVGGKEYDCTWLQMTSVTKVNGMEIENSTKVWTCKEIPLSGMVKMTNESKFGTMTQELIGSGSK